MKNKVGILTFHKADNYGAALQVLALQEVIYNLIQLDVEIVDYKQPFTRNLNTQFPQIRISKLYIKELLQYLWRLFLYNTPSAKKKRLKFSEFRDKYLKISKISFNSKENISDYNAYITGSDQVWNTSITDDDSTFYLNFGPTNIKRISYAASFGHENLSKKEKNYIREYLSTIDFLSVRERSGVEAIKKEMDVPVSLVLDPTLLLDKNKWEKICEEEIREKNDYLLLYGLEFNEEMLQIARITANTLNLKLLKIGSVGLSHSKVKIDKQINDAGPNEFIRLLLDAKFIVTNSFHGTALAVNFNKNFICVPHITRGTRMVSLLNLLKLERRLVVESKELKDDYDLNIDFTQANKQLQMERKNSINFLRTALADG